MYAAAPRCGRRGGGQRAVKIDVPWAKICIRTGPGRRGVLSANRGLTVGIRGWSDGGGSGDPAGTKERRAFGSGSDGGVGEGVASFLRGAAAAEAAFSFSRGGRDEGAVASSSQSQQWRRRLPRAAEGDHPMEVTARVLCLPPRATGVDSGGGRLLLPPSGDQRWHSGERSSDAGSNVGKERAPAGPDLRPAAEEELVEINLEDKRRRGVGSASLIHELEWETTGRGRVERGRELRREVKLCESLCRASGAGLLPREWRRERRLRAGEHLLPTSWGRRRRHDSKGGCLLRETTTASSPPREVTQGVASHGAVHTRRMNATGRAEVFFPRLPLDGPSRRGGQRQEARSASLHPASGKRHSI